MLRRARHAAAVVAAAAAVTLGLALPAAAEPNYPPAFTRITADRTIVAPRVAVHFSAQTFTPGSAVAVDVTGTSAQSLTVPVDADGVAHAAVAFDAVGAQTVTFRGVDLLGSPLALSAVITVVPEGSPGTGDPGSGGGSTGSNGSGGSGSGTTVGSGSGTGVGGTGSGSGASGSGSGSGASGSGSGTDVGSTGGTGSADGSGSGSLDASGSGVVGGTSTTTGGALAPVAVAAGLAGLLLALGIALIVAGRRRNRSADA